MNISVNPSSITQYNPFELIYKNSSPLIQNSTYSLNYRNHLNNNTIISKFDTSIPYINNICSICHDVYSNNMYLCSFNSNIISIISTETHKLIKNILIELTALIDGNLLNYKPIAIRNGNKYIIINDVLIKLDSNDREIYQIYTLQLNSPNGIAIDKNDNIYIADTGNNRILKLNTNGVVLTQFTNAYGNILLSSPNSIAVDSLGYMFILDLGNQRMMIMDRMGFENAVFPFTTNFNGEFIYLDNQNYLYITSNANKTIYKINRNSNFADPSSVIITDISGGGVIGNPIGQITKDNDTPSLIYNINSNNGSIIQSLDGNSDDTFLNNGMIGITTIIKDNYGNIYSINETTNELLKIKKNGEIFNIPNPSPNVYNSNYHVIETIDTSYHYLYIPDPSNVQIYYIDLAALNYDSSHVYITPPNAVPDFSYYPKPSYITFNKNTGELLLLDLCNNSLFNNVSAVAFDASYEYFYVCDSPVIYKFSYIDGSYSVFYNSPFNIKGIGVDSFQRVYTIEYGGVDNYCIMRIDADGNKTCLLNNSNEIQGILVDATNNIYYTKNGIYAIYQSLVFENARIPLGNQYVSLNVTDVLGNQIITDVSFYLHNSPDTIYSITDSYPNLISPSPKRLLPFSLFIQNPELYFYSNKNYLGKDKNDGIMGNQIIPFMNPVQTSGVSYIFSVNEYTQEIIVLNYDTRRIYKTDSNGVNNGITDIYDISTVINTHGQKFMNINPYNQTFLVYDSTYSNIYIYTFSCVLVEQPISINMDVETINMTRTGEIIVAATDGLNNSHIKIYDASGYLLNNVNSSLSSILSVTKYNNWVYLIGKYLDENVITGVDVSNNIEYKINGWEFYYPTEIITDVCGNLHILETLNGNIIKMFGGFYTTDSDKTIYYNKVEIIWSDKDAFQISIDEQGNRYFATNFSGIVKIFNHIDFDKLISTEWGDSVPLYLTDMSGDALASLFLQIVYYEFAEKIPYCRKKQMLSCLNGVNYNLLKTGGNDPRMSSKMRYANYIRR